MREEVKLVSLHLNNPPIKLRHIQAHMNAAYVYSELSYCKRLKVGAVLIQGNNIISIGYNGTPSGQSNCCEDENNNTLPTVIHAESNIFNKIPHSVDLSNTTLLITHAPCRSCAELIIERKVPVVIYDQLYRCTNGIDWLLTNQVTIRQLQQLYQERNEQ